MRGMKGVSKPAFIGSIVRTSKLGLLPLHSARTANIQ